VKTKEVNKAPLLLFHRLEVVVSLAGIPEEVPEGFLHLQNKLRVLRAVVVKNPGVLGGGRAPLGEVNIKGVGEFNSPLLSHALFVAGGEWPVDAADSIDLAANVPVVLPAALAGDFDLVGTGNRGAWGGSMTGSLTLVTAPPLSPAGLLAGGRRELALALVANSGTQVTA